MAIVLIWTSMKFVIFFFALEALAQISNWVDRIWNTKALKNLYSWAVGESNEVQKVRGKIVKFLQNISDCHKSCYFSTNGDIHIWSDELPSIIYK